MEYIRDATKAVLVALDALAAPCLFVYEKIPKPMPQTVNAAKHGFVPKSHLRYCHHGCTW